MGKVHRLTIVTYAGKAKSQQQLFDILAASLETANKWMVGR
jgi:hypothetical protein